jgi:cytochrome c biogenesis factor
VLFAIGVAGSSAYASSSEQQLKPGQTMRVPGYTLTYKRLVHTPTVTETGQTLETKAVLQIGGRSHGTLSTAQVQSSALGTSREVGIHTNWLRGEDLYVILDQYNGNTVFFQVLVKPLVNLIWVAGFVFLGGSLIAMWPDAREQRRLVARLSLARA